MPQRKKDAMEIREVLRRVRAGESDRIIAQAVKVDRKTVRRYREWADAQGLLAGEMPSLADVQASLSATLPPALPPQNVSTVEPYRDLVIRLRAAEVEVAAIHERLKERGYTGSYASVYRFVQRLEARTPEATVRVETRPGEEAQVDFGYAGRMWDPDTASERKTWAFVMTLSWSRHQYVEFVYDQKVATWLRCHRNAFQFFEGYMRNRQVLDRWLDNDHHLEYATFTQRKRGKAVVLAMVFSRFHIVEGTWLPEADGHSKASSLDTESCPTSLPRAAVA